MLPASPNPLSAQAALDRQVAAREQHLLWGNHLSFLGHATERSTEGRLLPREQHTQHLPTELYRRLHRPFTRPSPSKPGGCSGSPGLRSPAAAEPRLRVRGPPAIHSHPPPGCAPAPPRRTTGHQQRLCGQRRGHLRRGSSSPRTRARPRPGPASPSSCPRLDAAGKGRTSARTSYIHPETLARAALPARRVTGAAQWRVTLLR